MPRLETRLTPVDNVICRDEGSSGRKTRRLLLIPDLGVRLRASNGRKQTALPMCPSQLDCTRAV